MSESRNEVPQEETIVVWNLADVIEASIVEDALQQADVPAVIDSFHDSAYDGVYTFQKGWGRVRVPKSHANKAVAIIKEALKAEATDGE